MQERQIQFGKTLLSFIFIVLETDVMAGAPAAVLRACGDGHSLRVRENQAGSLMSIGGVAMPALGGPHLD